jgi:outer membrane protein TolC
MVKNRWLGILTLVFLGGMAAAQTKKSPPKTTPTSKPRVASTPAPVPTPAPTPAMISASAASAGANLCQPSISLSQKDVAEMVLRDGRRSKEINFKYQQSRLDLATGLSVFDWKFMAASGYRSDKSVGLTASPWNNKENFVTEISLAKSFMTGTTAAVKYKRDSFQGEANALYTPQAGLPAGTVDYLGFTMNQDIWANFFGSAYRGAWAAVQLNYEATSLMRTNELEDLVLESIRLFWTTYVSEQNFHDKVASRDRSKKLADAVRRKSGFGYANPGEFAQAQADFESRVIDVKVASNEYLQNLDKLNTLLGLPSSCEVKFVVSDVIPPVPHLPEKSVQELRSFRSGELKKKAAERDYDAAKSRDAPTVQLVGEVYSYGADREAGAAYSEVMAGGHPNYYAGVKIEYGFGSNLLGETRLNRRYRKELEEVAFSRLTQESQNSLVEAERKAQVSYTAVLSAIEQKKYREKALQEMSRSFTQGRTDISIYIDAMNKLSAAEIQYSQAIGNYQTALNEWAAARDELIPEAPEEK